MGKRVYKPKFHFPKTEFLSPFILHKVPQEIFISKVKSQVILRQRNIHESKLKYKKNYLNLEINFWRTHQYFERIEVKYVDNSGPKRTVRRQTELAETKTHVRTFGMCFHLYSTKKEKSPSDQHYPPH